MCSGFQGKRNSAGAASLRESQVICDVFTDFITDQHVVKRVSSFLVN